MSVIYKYQIKPIGNEFEIEIHESHEILTVQMQGGIPCLWLSCYPDTPKIKMKFTILATGQEYMPCQIREYIGTYQLENGLVYHLFQLYR